MSTGSFLALCAAVFAVAFGYTAIMPLLPQLLSPLMPEASALGLASHAGAYAGIYMLAGVLFSPLGGAASDRYGVRAAIGVGLAGSAAAFLASTFAEGVWSAYAARAAQGAFAAAVFPAAAAALAKIADTAERARKVAGLGIASLLGFFAAPALSAAVLSVRASTAVPAMLYASALVASAALLAVGAAVKAGAHDQPEAQGERPLPRRFLALNLLAYFGLGAFEVALPLSARGPLALQAEQVALLFAECSLVMLAAQSALMWAAKHRSRFERVLVAAIAAYGAGVLWLAAAASMGTATAAVGLVAAGSGLVLPLVGYLATLEIGARPGAALGALAAAGALGQAVGSASGGALYGYLGPAMFIATAFAVALGAWLASPSYMPRWLGGRPRCRRT